jgi:hypothetical protein
MVVQDAGFEGDFGVEAMGIFLPMPTYFGGWTALHPSNASLSASIGPAHSGGRSLRLGNQIFPPPLAVISTVSSAVQDVCISTACPVQVCVWVKANSGGPARIQVAQASFGAGVSFLPVPAVEAFSASSAWTQVCVTVGDAANPFAAGVDGLRIRLDPSLSGFADADFDDVSLSAACPSPTASPTATASATVTPTPSVSPTFSESPTRVIQFYQQPELIEERGIFPNPFAERAHIYFSLRVAAEATLTVYNVAGEPLFIRRYPGKAGKNEILWDGDNDSGQRCASGVYILRLQAEGVDRSQGGYWTQVVIQR